MTDRSRRVLIALIFIVGALLRSQDFLSPWVGEHNAWGGAMYGNIARNFVKYGYRETQFGPVVNSGYVPAGEFKFYYHYPPLLVWLVSVSYLIFGVHEWSARLIPLLFSLSLMALIFIFARHAFSQEVALLALLFSAIMPIENYYGAHVDVYGSLSVFFSLLALYGYARWLDHHRTHYLALCTLGIILGSMTAWYTYFLVPLILAHYYRFNFVPGKSRDHRLLIIAGSAIAVFALFMLHRHILLGSGRGEVLGSLTEKLLGRLSYGHMLGTVGDGVKPSASVSQQLRTFARMYSPPLVALTAVWFVFFIKDGLRRRLHNRDWFVLMLLGYGLLHNFAFPGFLRGHEYLIVSYVPGVAIAASVASLRCFQYVQDRWGLKAREIAAPVLLTIVVIAGLYFTQRLYSRNSSYSDTLVRWGETMRKHSDKSDVILVPSESDIVFQYYVDRDIRFDVDTMQKLLGSIEGKGKRYLFVVPVERRNEFPIVAHLRGRYPSWNEDGLVIFAICGFH